LDFRLLHLIATVIDACDHRPGSRLGHPPTETIRVVATLRRFLREGTPWRSLIATEDQASGSTLRRCLRRWARTGLLAKVQALLVGMLRGHPDLILDACSVRAKRGGDLTGPNPTDRAKQGTKYHVAVDGDGVPVACAATAANVNDTLAFERLFLAAFAVVVRIRTVFADKGYDAEHTTGICAAGSASSHASTGVVFHVDQGWASDAGPWSAASPGSWRTDAWRYAVTGSDSSSNRCYRPPAYSWLQGASPANSENRFYGPELSRERLQGAQVVLVRNGYGVAGTACSSRRPASAGSTVAAAGSSRAGAVGSRLRPRPCYIDDFWRRSDVIAAWKGFTDPAAAR
jgi:hypothetical protein